MIMDRLRECKRMVKRTRWLDARLVKLQCGTERITSVQCKTLPETDDYIALDEQLDKITGYERQYSAQLIEAMQDVYIRMEEYIYQHRGSGSNAKGTVVQGDSWTVA